MRTEAETLRITASARMPDGHPYSWAISFDIEQIMKARDPALVLFNSIEKLLRDFPNLVEKHIAAKEHDRWLEEIHRENKTTESNEHRA